MLIAKDIANELKARLERIQVVNGFMTDAGKDVLLGWRNLDQSFLLPNLTVAETSHQILSDVRAGNNARIQIEWTVEGLVEVGTEALASLYRIERDVIRAVYSPDAFLHGMVRKLSYAGRSFTGPEDGGKLAAIQIRILTEHAEVMP